MAAKKKRKPGSITFRADEEVVKMLKEMVENEPEMNDSVFLRLLIRYAHKNKPNLRE